MKDYKKGDEFTSKNSGTISTIIEIVSEDTLNWYGLEGPAFWINENGSSQLRLCTIEGLKELFIIPEVKK